MEAINDALQYTDHFCGKTTLRRSSGTFHKEDYLMLLQLFLYLRIRIFILPYELQSEIKSLEFRCRCSFSIHRIPVLEPWVIIQTQVHFCKSSELKTSLHGTVCVTILHTDIFDRRPSSLRKILKVLLL